MADDIASVTGPRLDGIVVPKVDGPDELEETVRRVRAAEREAGLPEHRVAVVALIETARGLLDVAGIARVPGVATLALGEGDLAADLGVTPSPGEPEFLLAREQVVVAAAAAGLEPPIAPVATDFRDLDAFRRSSEGLRRMGFGSRQAIHPAQVLVVNEVFTPSPTEVEAARETVAAFERAAAAQVGVVVDGAGRMVDEAVVRAARRTIARAGVTPGREGR
jgi:citrate lyase subunit beta/citryl-CoA lyase